MTRPRRVQWADETSSSTSSSSSSSSSPSSSASSSVSIANNHTQPNRNSKRIEAQFHQNELVQIRQYNRFAETLKYEARLPQDPTSKRRSRFDRNLSTVKEQDYESCESTVTTREDNSTTA